MKKLSIILVFYIALFSQWSSDPTENLLISNHEGTPAVPHVGVTILSKTYIGYYSQENSNYNVRLQYLDNEGNNVWGDEGILVSDKEQNSWVMDWDLEVLENDVCLAFADNRDGVPSINAYMISSDGSFLWGDDGIKLNTMFEFVGPPKLITSESDNSCIVTWQSSTPEGKEVVRVQKIAADGTLPWGNEGITISADGDVNCTYPQLVYNKYNDAFYIIYYQETGPFWAAVKHIYVDRIDFDGNSVWDEPVLASNLGQIPTASWPYVFGNFTEYPPDNGLAISWHMGATALHSYVQYIYADGTKMTDQGMLLSENSNQYQIHPVCGMYYMYDFPFQIVSLWKETDSNQSQHGLFAQTTDVPTAGNYYPNGIEIVPVGNDGINVVESVRLQAPGCIPNKFPFFIYQQTPDFGQVDYIKGVDPFNFSFSDDISLRETEKIHTTASSNNFDFTVVVWEDVDGNDTKIYAQNIFMPVGIEDDENLVETVNLSAYPNPFNPSTNISYTLDKASVTQLKIYSVNGSLVKDFGEKQQSAGSYKVNFDASEMAAGVYYYSLSLDGNVIQTNKMVLVK